MKSAASLRRFLSDAKFFEAYSRYNDEAGRYETWEEAVDRVMNMHIDYYKAGKNVPLLDVMDEAKQAYLDKHILGSQRVLQFGGDQILKHQARLYNCTASYVDRAEFFGEAFYLLLCGAGVGFSVQRHHVAKLPGIEKRTKIPKIHVIEDSIEGWATSLDVLLSSFFETGGKHPEYKGHRVYFDMTKIRPRGSKISGGFKAPGPDPLRLALDRIEHLLQGIVLKKNQVVQLKPLQAHDIIMHASDSVLSGGVRRSACISLFSHDDKEMLECKTGNWFNENPQRARANNSAVIERDAIDKKEFKEIIERIKQFGEPGFYFVDSKEHLTNPCLTADTWIMTAEGPIQITNLINKPFTAMVNGKGYASSGFWKTGTKPVFKVKTSRGYELRITDNHEVLTQDGMKRVDDLKIGKDELIINDNRGSHWGEEGQEEFDRGWLLGEMLGDGGFNPEKYPGYVRFWGEEKLEMASIARDIIQSNDDSYQLKERKPFNDTITVETKRFDTLAKPFLETRTKNIKSELERQSSSFTAGFLCGWFDADGSVQGNLEKGRSIRLWSTNLHNLKTAQRMLARLGIVSRLYENRLTRKTAAMPDGNGGTKHYKTKPGHELVIGRDNMVVFSERIGFRTPSKRNKLYDLVDNHTNGRPNYKETFKTKVISIEKDGVEDVYDCTVQDIHRFEANAQIVSNCVEIGLFPQHNGKSGWQFCNLTEINGGVCVNEQIFYKACRAAAILGTIQAGYTDIGFVNPITKKILRREALLGVSITGWMSNPDILFDEKVLQKGAKIVLETNKEVAGYLGINECARATCVKPSGTASVLLMTPAGIHPEHSPMYLRNVQMTKDTEVAQLLKSTNPNMVEDSAWSANHTDYVMSFPIVASKGSYYKDDLMGVKHLELVKKARKFWVEPGTNVSNSVDPKVRHNVSNTIVVDEWDSVADYIWKNRAFFSGVSFISDVGDKVYYQAPNTRILTPNEIIRKYKAGGIFASGLIVDGLKAFENLWIACATAEGMGEDLTSEDHINTSKRDWCRRFENFAKNYFNNDAKQAEYCVKDVFLLHKWAKIVQNFTDVDWSSLTEKHFIDADTLAAAACVGTDSSGIGGCSI